MKRIALACVLTFCTTLTACCPVPCCVIPLNLSGNTQVTEAPDTTVTEAPESTEPTTTTTAPTTTAPTYAYDTKPVNYTLPVVNPDKKLYDAPDGEYVGTIDAVGYYTIVEQATDADGYTWGRLENSTNWTLVYYEILPELEMTFSSGAGAWSTTLSLSGNGSFAGSYHDSDMGDSGDGYPGGTCYVCDFSGTFRVADIQGHTAKLEMTELKHKQKADATWIENGIRYIASSAYGLEGGTEFVLYLPGTPVEQIPEEARGWCSYPSSGTLDSCVLYCPELGTAFA